jgi:predicted DNA-binding protein
MTEQKKVNRFNKPVNTTMDDQLKEQLNELAQQNMMTLSGLIRWVGAKVVDDPEQFGLRAERVKQ